MKKQAKHILGLVIVLAVCLGAYFGLRAWNAAQAEKEAGAEEDAVIHLAALTDITGISFSNAEVELSFEKAEDTWQYTGDPDFPLDASYLENLETILANFTAVRKIVDSDTFAAYGLETPSCWLAAETADGGSFQIDIGSSAGSYYYAKTDDSGAVYTIESGLVSGISYGLLDLVQLESFPALSEETIKSIAVTAGETNIKIVKETAEETENSGEVDPVYTWFLVEGDGTRQEVSGDNTALGSLLDVLDSLAFNTCHDYRASDEAITAAGLGAPTDTLTIEYDGGILSLLIGSAEETSGDYFAMLSGSSMINTLPADLTVTLLTPNLAALRTAAGDSSADSATAVG